MTDTLRTPECNPTEQPIAFDTRTRRVMELRKQVREGTYALDAHAVASAILAEWLAVPELTSSEETFALLDSSAGRRTVGARFLVEKSELEQPGVSVMTA